MATTFQVGNVKVKVEDKALAEQIADAIDTESETYTVAGLQKAAPGMMRAVLNEMDAVRAAGMSFGKDDYVKVANGKATAEIKGDRRTRHPPGTSIGAL